MHNQVAVVTFAGYRNEQLQRENTSKTTLNSISNVTYPALLLISVVTFHVGRINIANLYRRTKFHQRLLVRVEYLQRLVKVGRLRVALCRQKTGSF